MCKSVEKMVRVDLEATGLPYVLEQGSRHVKVKLAGYLVGVLPMNDRNSASHERAYLNIRSQIRRKAKELLGEA